MPYKNNQGVNVHYEVRGAGPAIVFNHGFPRDRTSWYAYADLLQDKYTCVYRRPRHGTYRQAARNRCLQL